MCFNVFQPFPWSSSGGPFHKLWCCALSFVVCRQETDVRSSFECGGEVFDLIFPESSQSSHEAVLDDSMCIWQNVLGASYLAGHINEQPTAAWTLKVAQAQCVALQESCSGITAQVCGDTSIYTLRAMMWPLRSGYGEVSWVKICSRAVDSEGVSKFGQICFSAAPHPPDATMGSAVWEDVVAKGPYGPISTSVSRWGMKADKIHDRACWNVPESFKWQLIRQFISDAVEIMSIDQLEVSRTMRSKFEQVLKLMYAGSLQDTCKLGHIIISAVPIFLFRHEFDETQFYTLMSQLSEEVCLDVEAAVTGLDWPLLQVLLYIRSDANIVRWRDDSYDKAYDAVERLHSDMLFDVLPHVTAKLPRCAVLLALAILNALPILEVLEEVGALLRKVRSETNFGCRLLVQSSWPILELLAKLRAKSTLRLIKRLSFDRGACSPGNAGDTWHLIAPPLLSQILHSDGTVIPRLPVHTWHAPAHNTAHWFSHVPGDQQYIAVHMPNTSWKSLYFSTERPSIGLFVGDLRQVVMDWSQAFLDATASVGVGPPHIAFSADEILPGVLYFARPTRFLDNGAFAYSSSLSGAIKDRLNSVMSRGSPIFPRPDEMKLFENKPGLWQIFSERGVEHPYTIHMYSSGDAASLSSAELDRLVFPVVLKHPHAAGSEHMNQCIDRATFAECVDDWFVKHQAESVIVQRKLNFTREVRVTFVFGRIVHFYWRVKTSAEQLSASTKFGTEIDFQFPERERLGSAIRRWVAWFSDAIDLHIGGVDLCWEHDDFRSKPFVFEVSPVFDMNPPPTETFKNRPYKEFKNEAAEEYETSKLLTYTSLYAVAIPLALCRLRGSVVYVDVDNTVADSSLRIKTWTKPSWPGERIDSQAYTASALQQDPVLGPALEALRVIALEHAVVFLSARGRWPGAYEATLAWLEVNALPFSALQLVDTAADKANWLAGERERGRVVTLLIDDLSQDHHTATPVPDSKTIGLLQRFGIPYFAFDFTQPERAWDDVVWNLAHAVPPACHMHARAVEALPSAPPR